MKSPTLADLRRHAVARSLFKPGSLPRAIERLGFVQADPIRAPARAQDLTLRHRVANYQAGELELRYPKLAVEEDFFVNYGFVPRAVQGLMHPRQARTAWNAARKAQAQEVLAFVRERGVAHPREVEAHFAFGKSRNWFGGTSNAGTQLLDGMHYRGLLRVARREGGTRLYAPAPQWEPATPAQMRERMDALADMVVAKYAPLPAASLSGLVMWLRAAAPQWEAQRKRALADVKARLAQVRIDGVDWYWPAQEKPLRAVVDEQVRLLAPFDPICWDRRRFELLWGWAYRFEAYTPAPKRKMGYYALPMLWRDEVLGFANLALAEGMLRCEAGLVKGGSLPKALKLGLEEELQRMAQFLGEPEARLQLTVRR